MAIRSKPKREWPGPIARGKVGLARVSCIGCGKRVGLIWFGGGPDLVELSPATVKDAGGRERTALLIHQCDPVPGKGEP